MEERLGLLYVLHDQCIGGFHVASWTIGTISEVLSMLEQATAGEDGWKVNEVDWVDNQFDVALYTHHPTATDTWDYSEGYDLELDGKRISVDPNVFKIKEKTYRGGWLYNTDLVLNPVFKDSRHEYHPASRGDWREGKDTDCVMTFEAEKLRKKWLSLCRYGC